MNSSVCPICLEGNLIEQSYSGTLINKGIEVRIDTFLHSVCSVCEVEIANSEQTKHNKLLAIEFQRATEGYLAPSDVSRIRKRLKLNCRDASAIIGGGGIAFSKYENGVIKQSTAVDNLLRLLDSHPELLSELKDFNKQRQILEQFQAKLFFQAEAEPSEAQSGSVLTWVLNTGRNTLETIFKPVMDLSVTTEFQSTTGTWKTLT